MAHDWTKVCRHRSSSNHVPLNVNKTWKKVLRWTEPNAPILQCLKIWNTGVQELFTELKNNDFRARKVPPNSGRIAKCRETYRISHIIKNGPKISLGTRFLGVGASDSPETW